MAKSPYEERILEELRCIHAKEEMLYKILQDVQVRKNSDDKEKKK